MSTRQMLFLASAYTQNLAEQYTMYAEALLNGRIIPARDRVELASNAHIVRSLITARDQAQT